MTVDLHLHTTASDGRLTPTELVQLAVRRGMKVIAIADHDSTDGIDEAMEAAKAYPQLTIIPSIEVSTDITDNEVHVLGYFIRYHDAEFQHTLEKLRASRITRALKMLSKLENLSVRVKWERVQELAQGGVVGRLHIAQAVLEGGHVATIQEAFSRYIGRRGPAYADREKLTPLEAGQLIVRVGGLPVLAHPADIDDIDGLILEMKSTGMVGMEVYYSGYDRETIQRLLATARRHDLIPCGGSDYHGLENDPEKELGIVAVPMESVQQLVALAERSMEEAVDP
ncbi:MAG: PHP domain-containing protein [Chloroflexota bacterium]